ncbi:hypothetical protein LCGC14_3093350 [marine sediment metagenome]|uniref:Uncharacterized protein n=1 Tax=marine sediment metagenome TaxID=412755 RepID=A0A0F8WYQ3_9ZZZZ
MGEIVREEDFRRPLTIWHEDNIKRQFIHTATMLRLALSRLKHQLYVVSSTWAMLGIVQLQFSMFCGTGVVHHKSPPLTVEYP